MIAADPGPMKHVDSNALLVKAVGGRRLDGRGCVRIHVASQPGVPQEGGVLCELVAGKDVAQNDAVRALVCWPPPRCS